MQIEPGDLHAAFRIFIEKIRGGTKYRLKNAESMNYVNVVKQTLGTYLYKLVPSSLPQKSTQSLLITEHLSSIRQQMMLQNSGMLCHKDGVGSSCHKGSCFDKFILTRKPIN